MKKEEIERAWQDPRIKDLMNPIVSFLKSERYIKVSAKGVEGQHHIWHTWGGTYRYESLAIKYHKRTLYREKYDWQGNSSISHLNIKRIAKYRHLLTGLREEYERIWKEVEDSRRESLLRERQRKARNIKDIKARIDAAFWRTDR